MTDRNPATAPRLLMGPGPSSLDPRVYAALGRPLVGHLDPQFLRIMDETQERLRRVFVTANRLTLPISGTGSAGMEAALVNLVEPGDEVIVGVAGYFGERLHTVATRVGATVHRLDRPWGGVFEPAAIAEALHRFPKARLVALVHGETSTGALQPLKEIGELCRTADCLVLVDAVATLGGIELPVDDWQIDACYSGSQKCLSAPPGLAPITFGPRAQAKLRARRRPVASYYFDLLELHRYWSEGSPRAYHHTAPIMLINALHEALGLLLEEGLEASCARHLRLSRSLLAGLEELGFREFDRGEHRTPMVNPVWLPAGLDDAAARNRLREVHNIEVAGGLGDLAGKLWRIGLMGTSCSAANVAALLHAVEEVLAHQGLREARPAPAVPA